MKRLFFAIPLPEERKADLLQPFHEKKIHGIRWLSNHNLHVTVYFIGSVSNEKLNEISQQAADVCSSFASFNLAFESFKVIYKKKKPVMIWAGFKENNFFQDLSFRLSETGISSGNQIKEAVPHVTLARIKQLHEIPFELPRAIPFDFKVDGLELWESHLSQSGSEYEKIERWALRL